MHRNDKQSVLKRAVLSTALIAAFAGAPLAANAAGMGKITVLSALGQPLRAELDVTATREELASLVARVAPVEAFRQANLEYAGVLSGMKFTLEKRADGRPYFKVSTDRAVNDPFIDMLVELGWSSGRLVREYAFLLDPPPDLKNGTASAGLVAAPVAQPSSELVPALSPQASAPAVEQQTAPTPPKKKMAAPATEKKSELEGEAAPDAEDPAKDSTTHKVKPGDTLGKIAAENAIEGVNLNQMLVALFNGNRDAFIGGNINRLRAGKILTIPDAAAAGAVSAPEARKIVVAQAADFNAYRNNLAAAAEEAPAVEETQQSSSGKITPKVEDKSPEVSGKDKLQVSRSEADARTGKGTLSEEDTIARDKALKEANSRIGDLEKNLGDLKQLAEMKSQAAQKAVPPSNNSSATPTPAVPAEVVAAANTGIALEGAPAVSATAVISAAVSAVAVAPAAEAMPQLKPPKPIITSPESSQPSFTEDNPLLVYGGGAAIAALLGFLGFRNWKRKRDADSSESVTISDLSASSVFGSAGSESVDTGTPSQADFAHSTLDAVDTSKTGVDPIQEAEVYMAYGRDSQAEEILRDALRKNPDNLAVYLKLLEIYAGRKSVAQFNEVATDLHDRSGGNGPEWSKAVELGKSLDPANPLYGAEVSVAEAEHAPLSTMLVDDPMVSTTILTPQSTQAPESVVPQAIEEVSGPLDFDLDLGAPEQAPPPGAFSAVNTASSEAASDLDFDLDLDLGNGKEAIAAASGNDLDINLDTPADEGHTIDFNIAAPASAPPLSLASDTSAAHGLDFDLGDSFGDSASAPALDLSSINLDLDKPADAAYGAAADSSEVATKLELAQAYEEMGDEEGARELLQEVIAEGSPAQQEVARNKLAQLK